MDKYQDYILNASNECPKWKPFAGKSKKCSRCYEGVKPKRSYPLRISKKCKKKGSKKNIIPSVSDTLQRKGNCSSCFDFGIRQYQDSHKSIDRFNKKYFTSIRKTTKKSGVSWDVLVIKKGTMLWHGWKIYDDDSANQLYLANENLWLADFSNAQRYAKEVNSNMSLFIVKEDIELFDCDSLYNYWKSHSILIRPLKDYYKQNIKSLDYKREKELKKPDTPPRKLGGYTTKTKKQKIDKIDNDIVILKKEIELFDENSSNYSIIDLSKLYKDLQSKKNKKESNRVRGDLNMGNYDLLLSSYFGPALFGESYPERWFEDELTKEGQDELRVDIHSRVVHGPMISYQDFEDLTFKYRKSRTVDRRSHYTVDDIFIDILNIIGFSGMSYLKVDKNKNKRPDNSSNHHHQEICVLQKDSHKLELVLSYPIKPEI